MWQSLKTKLLCGTGAILTSLFLSQSTSYVTLRMASLDYLCSFPPLLYRPRFKTHLFRHPVLSKVPWYQVLCKQPPAFLSVYLIIPLPEVILYLSKWAVSLSTAKTFLSLLLQDNTINTEKKDGSAVKSFSCGEPTLELQHPYVCSLPSIILFPGDLTSFSGLCRQQGCTWWANIYTGITPIDIKI